MSMSHIATPFALYNLPRPRLRLYRLRSSIIKIFNAVVVASMLASTSGVAMASAAADAGTSMESPLPVPHMSIEALVEPNIVQSTFDFDGEGWTIEGDGDGPTYHSTGGNPGGYITATDLALGEYWYWHMAGP